MSLTLVVPSPLQSARERWRTSRRLGGGGRRGGGDGTALGGQQGAEDRQPQAGREQAAVSCGMTRRVMAAHGSRSCPDSLSWFLEKRSRFQAHSGQVRVSQE